MFGSFAVFSSEMESDKVNKSKLDITEGASAQFPI